MQILDQIIVIHTVGAHHGEKNQSFCCSGGFDEEMSRHLCKKQKISSATVSNDVSRDVGTSGLQSSGRVCIPHASFTFKSGFICARPKLVFP